MISFSNGCALVPQPEALENVGRVIIHYSNESFSQSCIETLHESRKRK